jgi:hypothetical protein
MELSITREPNSYLAVRSLEAIPTGFFESLKYINWLQFYIIINGQLLLGFLQPPNEDIIAPASLFCATS